MYSLKEFLHCRPYFTKNKYCKVIVKLLSYCTLLYVLGRKIAVDASMCLYQFLTAVRSEGSQLMSADGETTRQVLGLYLYCTNNLNTYKIKIIHREKYTK